MGPNIESFDKVLQKHEMDYPVQYYKKIVTEFNIGNSDYAVDLLKAIPKTFQRMFLSQYSESQPIAVYMLLGEKSDDEQ